MDTFFGADWNIVSFRSFQHLHPAHRWKRRPRLTGDKTHDRWVGTCYTSSDEDIGVLAIQAGQARDCPRYSGGKYRQFETQESRPGRTAEPGDILLAERSADHH